MRILFFLFFFLLCNFSESSQIENCSFLTEKYGKKYKIPNNLLTSIAFVESRWRINKKFAMSNKKKLINNSY